MAVPYNHIEVENKWRKKWEEHPVNVNDGKKPKYYCLDMFPYPSGAGLHVGHWRGYVISDVWARYKMMDGGHYVIHPMGWDAFGLPAENYAIKTGQHPSISTAANVANIRRQIDQIGAIRDWDMEVNTTDPAFYKWTQWIFVQMFKHGLAYEKEMPLNWCPNCKAVLANEEVVDGKCERCGSDVTKKNPGSAAPTAPKSSSKWMGAMRRSRSTPHVRTPFTERLSWYWLPNMNWSGN